MSYGIPPASSIFDIANELAITSGKKRIPKIMKEIRKAACRQETDVSVGKYSWLEVDELIRIFEAQGYSAGHGPDGWGRPGVRIDWSPK